MIRLAASVNVCLRTSSSCPCALVLRSCLAAGACPHCLVPAYHGPCCHALQGTVAQATTSVWEKPRGCFLPGHRSSACREACWSRWESRARRCVHPRFAVCTGSIASQSRRLRRPARWRGSFVQQCVMIVVHAWRSWCRCWQGGKQWECPFWCCGAPSPVASELIAVP